ncbi:hypothetical protein M413DRAFT_141913 [Hebeloma cylindrosporum]|uniref:Histone chaperone RTT106/FACT complex subunit SPT16-like middle domain-containing protein n=1 Tax=Hebeloma cylindrosporum TaxID=76867 RepID=A0A0C2XWD2_HEBCY|nr:hypothetical protein M413DRAFT_141913 [Hebeloma cylindrosporum h7]
MASSSLYLRSVLPALPTPIASKIRTLCASSPDNELIFEHLIRLLAGAEPEAEASSKDLKGSWTEKQADALKILAGLQPPDKKRGREEDPDDVQQAKRQRLDPGDPLFTLHAISTTSPVRKKVDVTIHTNAITFTHPTSRAVEATIPVDSLNRAFIVPTRGKTKPHWTVVLLSSDVPAEKPKPNTTASDNEQQIIFGLDAAPSTAFKVTSHPTVVESPRGSPTLPHIHTFLSHLPKPVAVVIPSVSVFKSACPGIGANASEGIPGVEAYRGAKPGNLWFAKEGVLWGESKPCEFWAVGDLLNREEGVRVVGAGKTCSVILTRRMQSSHQDKHDEEEGDETEFGMVDSREREGIYEWVRKHRNLFAGGAPPNVAVAATTGSSKSSNSSAKDRKVHHPSSSGPLTIRTLQDGDSDSEDGDFEDSSVEDLDGSERMSEEEGDDSSDEDSSNSGEGSGVDHDADADNDNDMDTNDDDGPLDPAHHPLLRPGAMPRMSKAAMEMAVGIVEDAFGGASDGNEVEEEDELDD